MYRTGAHDGPGGTGDLISSALALRLHLPFGRNVVLLPSGPILLILQLWRDELFSRLFDDGLRFEFIFGK